MTAKPDHNVPGPNTSKWFNHDDKPWYFRPLVGRRLTFLFSGLTRLGLHQVRYMSNDIIDIISFSFIEMTLWWVLPLPVSVSPLQINIISTKYNHNKENTFTIENVYIGPISVCYTNRHFSNIWLKKHWWKNAEVFTKDYVVGWEQNSGLRPMSWLWYHHLLQLVHRVSHGPALAHAGSTESCSVCH